MIFFRKLSAEFFLRLGLGAMFLYSGLDLIRHPTAWHWAVRPIIKWAPVSLQPSLNAPGFLDQYLKLQGLTELTFASILLLWFLPKVLVRLAALLIVLEMAVILILIPIDAITFRDLGLLGAGLALMRLAVKN